VGVLRLFPIAFLLLTLPALAAMEESDEFHLLFADIPAVFAAARYWQPVSQAPASIDIVTAEQIQRFGYRTLAEAVNSLPGFQVTYDRGYHRLQTRGFQLPGDYNSRILLLIDGHRVNENLQDYAGIGTDFLLDLDDVERIEVIRGPGSALYGTSAFFAVVNVITKSGADLDGVRLGAETGSFAAHEGQLAFGKRFQSGLTVYFSAGRHGSDGRRVLDFPGLEKVREADGQDGRRLFGKIAWHGWTLSGAFMDRDKDTPDFTGTPIPLRANYTDSRAYTDLQGRHRLGPWRTTLRLFWDRYQFRGRYPFPGVTNIDVWHGEWAGAEAILERTVFQDHHLLLGGEFRGNYLQRMDNFDRDPKLFWAANRFHSTFFGFYFQDEWRIGERLTLHAGLRIDHYSHTDDTPVTPRLGLIYTPFPETTLKLLYGEAYRAPTAFESRYRCCDGAWIANSTLDPERVRTLEGVWEQRLGRHLDWRLSSYVYRADDLIASRETDGITRFDNRGKATSVGVEALLRYRYRDLEAQLSYSFQQVEDQDGKRWPDSPRHLVKSRLAVPLWRDKLFGALELNYTGPRPTTLGGRSGDFVQMNLTLSSLELLPGLRLSASLYNVLDDHYRDPPHPPVIPVEIPQDGRTFRIKASYQF